MKYEIMSDLAILGMRVDNALEIVNLLLDDDERGKAFVNYRLKFHMQKAKSSYLRSEKLFSESKNDLEKYANYAVMLNACNRYEYLKELYHESCSEKEKVWAERFFPNSFLDDFEQYEEKRVFQLVRLGMKQKNAIDLIALVDNDNIDESTKVTSFKKIVTANIIATRKHREQATEILNDNEFEFYHRLGLHSESLKRVVYLIDLATEYGLNLGLANKTYENLKDDKQWSDSHYHRLNSL